MELVGTGIAAEQEHVFWIRRSGSSGAEHRAAQGLGPGCPRMEEEQGRGTTAARILAMTARASEGMFNPGYSDLQSAGWIEGLTQCLINRHAERECSTVSL